MRSHVTRRSFLRYASWTSAGTLASSLLPFEALLAQAEPLAENDTILVSIYLGGGLDGAHMLIPTSTADYGHYVDRRGALAVPLSGLLPLSTDASLHARLPRLRDRFAGGNVAFVRGVDLVAGSGFDRLSHFDKTDYVMMGRLAPSGPPKGIWARWADMLAPNPLLCATVDFGVPMLFQGGQSLQATGLPSGFDGVLGTDDSPENVALAAAFTNLGASFGVMPGLEATAARSGAAAVEVTSKLAHAYPQLIEGEGELTRKLRVIAGLIDANLTGTRIYATVFGGFDTHENQLSDLEDKLFPELDLALETFFTSLTRTANVVVMVWTEFGRRPEANRTGTDHGTANNVILLGDRVRGGIYGGQPSFAPGALDADGNLIGSTQFGSIYADLISRFLGGDADAILGRPYDSLGLLI